MPIMAEPLMNCFLVIMPDCLPKHTTQLRKFRIIMAAKTKAIPGGRQKTGDEV